MLRLTATSGSQSSHRLSLVHRALPIASFFHSKPKAIVPRLNSSPTGLSFRPPSAPIGQHLSAPPSSIGGDPREDTGKGVDVRMGKWGGERDSEVGGRGRRGGVGLAVEGGSLAGGNKEGRRGGKELEVIAPSSRGRERKSLESRHTSQGTELSPRSQGLSVTLVPFWVSGVATRAKVSTRVMS
jgi:hypothetical protein